MASRDTTPQLVIQDGSLRFDFAAQTAASAAPQRLVGDRYFATTPAPGSVFRRSIFSEASTDRQDLPESQNWRETTQTPSGDCSGDEDDDYDEDDDDGDDDCDEVDEEAGTLVAANHFSLDNNGIANSSDGVRNRVSEKMSNAYAKFHSSVGSSREKLAKDNGLVPSVGDDASERPIESHQHGRATNYHGTVTTAEPQDTHHLQFLQGPEGQKEFMVENGRSFRGGKDVADLSEPGESLRAILSDPFTGTLMDDAMILPCGHSFGSNGLQQVLRMKACFTCSQPMTEDSVAPNLSLRAAVQAFLREEASVLCRASKKRRFDQDRGNYGDAYFDQPRGRGVQFPLLVADRVIIKGNKRTPLRFVGREAIVTTQCLNGWYVVKTLDSAESVKLQYRSLAKITDHSSSSWPSSSSKTSSWL